MNKVDGFKCPICFDSAECDNINLKCGHAFGRSCIREWLESSNQINCPVCQKQFTDDDIKQITKISLQERMSIISKKTIKMFNPAILTHNSPVAPSFAAGGAVGVFGAAAAGVAGAGLAGPATTALAGLTVGTFWASAGTEFGRATGVANGIATGVATGVIFGTVGSFNLAVWSAVGAAVGAANEYFEKNY
ncbi:hypothetical protein J7438_19410 [Thalassotalea sp. G20_0]|nr:MULTISPECIES: RING finger domain-containing protein [Gammaproteobacteria]MBO9496228.1 hypothetical protein [Thalassotalea sp. G20_0]